MRSLIQRIEASPLLLRVVPFAIFVVLTFFQGSFGESSRYWIYLIKTVAGAWLIWLMRPRVNEMRWKISAEAIVAGIAIFGIWVGLDGWYPKFGNATQPWNPHAEFGEGASLAWIFVMVRIAGSALVVPPLEEVFYRSFLYRYVARPDFENTELGEFLFKPFLITAVIFGAAHYEWFAAFLSAMAFQALVIRKNRLGDAMTAHGLANLLLGCWVAWKGAWHFW